MLTNMSNIVPTPPQCIIDIIINTIMLHDNISSPYVDDDDDHLTICVCERFNQTISTSNSNYSIVHTTLHTCLLLLLFFLQSTVLVTFLFVVNTSCAYWSAQIPILTKRDKFFGVSVSQKMKQSFSYYIFFVSQLNGAISYTVSDKWAFTIHKSQICCISLGIIRFYKYINI